MSSEEKCQALRETLISGHETLVSSIGRATEVSEREIAAASESLGQMVQEALAQSDELERLSELNHSDIGVLRAINEVSTFAEYAGEQTRAFEQLIDEAMDEARALERTITQLERICTAWNTLLIITRTESARLDRGRDVDGGSDQQAELIQEVREIAEGLHKHALDILRDFPVLDSGSRRMRSVCEQFDMQYREASRAINWNLEFQESVLEQMRSAMSSQSPRILRSSREALSLLQFHEPMVQRLKALDERYAEVLRAVSGQLELPPDAEPLGFEAAPSGAADAPRGPAAGEPVFF
jgi:hypothetical protein